jgi:hypothetical protein
MTISVHGCLDGLYPVHAKLLEYVMSILRLVNKAILDLLDLKFKKECENSQHAHFKPIGHDFAKLITKRFVSRIKDNVIIIYLAYE